MAADTGNGATLVLGTTGTIASVVEMTLPEWTLEKIEDSHLGTTNFKTYIPGDLCEPGEITATVVFDSELSTYPTISSTTGSWDAAETVTVTFPISNTSHTTAPKIAGTGFITGFSFPQLANNTLQTATITIALDGKTEPAFTKSS